MSTPTPNRGYARVPADGLGENPRTVSAGKLYDAITAIDLDVEELFDDKADAAAVTDAIDDAIDAAVAEAVAVIRDSVGASLDTLAEVATALSGKQPLDDELTALAAVATNGLYARTGAGAVAARTITGTTDEVTVTNGDGVAGNPTITLAAAVKPGKTMVPILAAALIPNTTNGPATGTTETSTNKVMLSTLDFDQSTLERAQITIPMPKSWNEGTITARFRWTAPSGSGSVVWGCSAVALSDDDPIDAAFGTGQTVTDALTATGDLMTTAETSAITIGGTPQEGDLVCFRFYRDAANGSDTFNADAKLIAADLFITTTAHNDA